MGMVSQHLQNTVDDGVNDANSTRPPDTAFEFPFLLVVFPQ